VTPQVQVLEEVTRVAPLGLRFWDVAMQSPAETGLTVSAYPDAYPELITPASANASGIYSFSDLPGLRRAGNGAGDDSYWSANPPTVPYTVEVSDPQNRYLPFQLAVLLPWRGLYGLEGSPPLPIPVPDGGWLPIFPTAARPAGGVTGMIRGTLQDPSGAEAAWAVVTAQATGGAPVTGVADDRGVISVPIPYPELQTTLAGSPLGPTLLPLSLQSWPLTVRVYYEPFSIPTGSPDLKDVLSQSEASVWRDTSMSARATAFNLDYGTDLILRSVDAVSGRQLSYLLVTAAGSPL